MANNFSGAIVAAVAGFATAFVTCLVFFYFVSKPTQPVDARPTNQNVASPQPTSPDIRPDPEIKAENVKSVSIKTVYKDYFRPGDRCAKTYNEYFGNDDGVSSASSPCTILITFDREGKATRSVEIRRWNKRAREYRVVETSAETSHTTPEQFNSIVETVVGNEAFKAYKEGMSITASNCSVTVDSSSGIKTAMSNLDENTTVFLQMVNAFKQLEMRLDWTTA